MDYREKEHREELVRLLYEEAEDESSLRRLIDENPHLREEYANLREAHQLLAARKQPRPAPEVVDEIVAVASATGRPSGRRAVHSLLSARYWMSAAAALILALGGTLWFQIERTGTAQEATMESVLAWDEEDELQSIYFRIQALKEQNDGLLWDESGIPLEMVPLDDHGSRRLQQREALHQW